MQVAAVGDGKIYFTASLSESGGFMLMQFDVGTSTLTTLTAVSMASPFTIYDGKPYFYTQDYNLAR
ncbi:hypothetical protein [Niveispirillum sp. KHB5.9]|uniref:hypothetical protein n=1 Tax=Niveispirillum sp. KHB5.9 TaxID=3400269 RepID=UPI003A84B960